MFNRRRKKETVEVVWFEGSLYLKYMPEFFCLLVFHIVTYYCNVVEHTNANLRPAFPQPFLLPPPSGTSDRCLCASEEGHLESSRRLIRFFFFYALNVSCLFLAFPSHLSSVLCTVQPSLFALFPFPSPFFVSSPLFFLFADQHAKANGSRKEN